MPIPAYIYVIKPPEGDASLSSTSDTETKEWTSSHSLSSLNSSWSRWNSSDANICCRLSSNAPSLEQQQTSNVCSTGSIISRRPWPQNALENHAPFQQPSNYNEQKLRPSRLTNAPPKLRRSPQPKSAKKPPQAPVRQPSLSASCKS